MAALVVAQVCAYDFDANKPVKMPNAFTSKVAGGNEYAQLPYSVSPFAYDYDSKNDVYTVYFYIMNNYGQTVNVASTWVYPTETYYQLNQRMEMEAWLEYQSQAGDFENGLMAFIMNYRGGRIQIGGACYQ